MRKIRHIVVSTIGSDSCKRAENKGIELAKKENAQLTFLYIVDTSFLSGIPRRIHGVDSAEKDLRRIGRIILERALERSVKKGLKAETAIRTGSVMEELKRFLMESQTDLLLIGCEKRGLLDKHLLKQSQKELEKITGIQVKEIK
ncbi:MAG: universal stress protein [Candidatus Hydrothermarchaeota archaeon]|nr:universal stress protein [Candidatus Hydrothermarchaeota archaeon]